MLIHLLACSVCWGASQDPVVHGTKLSIVFLLSLTYLLLGGGVGMVFIVRRKAIRAAAAATAADQPELAPPPPRSED
jgi:flagellar basal body-associated protein FliL